eukprot:361013-Heterocapsa_arctica.AAC.1
MSCARSVRTSQGFFTAWPSMSEAHKHSRRSLLYVAGPSGAAATPARAIRHPPAAIRTPLGTRLRRRFASSSRRGAEKSARPRSCASIVL